eukprot:scaffold229905_cov58-Attheya_sp.AAC.2
MAGGPSNRIEITGKGGTPVYASGNVYGAILDPAFCGRLLEFLPGDEDVVCPISQMENAEIRLNRMRIGTVGTCEDSDDLTDEDGDYASLYTQYFPSSHGIGGWGIMTLSVKFGPLPKQTRGSKTHCTPKQFRDENIRDVIFSTIDIENEDNDIAIVEDWALQ